jgi:hypothetical protein
MTLANGRVCWWFVAIGSDKVPEAFSGIGEAELDRPAAGLHLASAERSELDSVGGGREAGVPVEHECAGG